MWRQTHKWLFTSRMDGYYIYIYSTVCGIHAHCSAIHNFLLSWQSKLSTNIIWIYAYKPNLSRLERMQRFLGKICNRSKCLTYVVASAPAMTGSDLIRRFRLFLGQCSQIYCTLETMWNSIEKECQKPCGTVLLRKLLLKYVGRKEDIIIQWVTNVKSNT